MLRGPTRIGKSLLTMATLSAACLLGAPQDVHASLAIYLQEDSGTISAATPLIPPSPANFTSATFTGAFGSASSGVANNDFQLEITGVSSDNGTLLSDLLGSTSSVHNTTAATHTIHIWLVQTDYTLPAGTPLNVESGMTFNQVLGTVTPTGVFQAWFDPNNGSTLPPAGTVPTNGAQNVVATVGPLSTTDSRTGTFARTGAMYSLISVANIELTAGGTMNFSNHVAVTGTPEPATVASALLGLGLAGGLARLRRRHAVA